MFFLKNLKNEGSLENFKPLENIQVWMGRSFLFRQGQRWRHADLYLLVWLIYFDSFMDILGYSEACEVDDWVFETRNLWKYSMMLTV